MEATIVMETQAAERRGVDRRRRSTPLLSKYTLFGGRRAADRRGNPSQEGTFVDRYDASLFLLLCLIALFNLLDCFFTLVQIGRGAEEWNPFVRQLLVHGPGLFIFIKSLGIGLVLCFLCLHKNFALARKTMFFAFFMYFGVFVYHLSIFNF